MKNNDLQKFLDIQNKIIKNALLINLLQAKFYAESEVKIGYTIHNVDEATKHSLEQVGRFPKSMMYSVMAMFVSPFCVKIGLKFDDFPTLWEREYNLLRTPLSELVVEIYYTYKIHPAKVDKVFSARKIPKDFTIFLHQNASDNLWKCGFKRKDEKTKCESEVIDEEVLNGYMLVLDNTLKKYRTFANILLELSKTGTYVRHTTCEIIQLSLSQNNLISVWLENKVENNVNMMTIKVSEVVPSNSKKLPFILTGI